MIILNLNSNTIINNNFLDYDHLKFISIELNKITETEYFLFMYILFTVYTIYSIYLSFSYIIFFL